MFGVKKSSKGQAMVEFALTLPLLLLLLMGIADLGRWLIALSQSADAARQAVRYGIVTGVENKFAMPQYLNCAEIEQKARQLPGIAAMSNAQITIFYEEVDGTFISNCVAGLDDWNPPTSDPNYDPNWTGWDGKVLAVRVKGSIAPITPLLIPFTNAIKFEYTARRTIEVNGAVFTAEWTTPPQAVQGFTAAVNCANGKVDFSWTAVDTTVVKRLEIRNSLTNTTVSNLTNPSQTTCTNCDTLSSATNWFGMYYMVAFSGDTNEMAGPTSTDAIASCPNNNNTATPTLNGKVEKTGNNGNPQNFPDVTVTLTYAGADGSLGTGDDVAWTTTSSNQGNYSFNLTQGGLYRVSVPNPFSGRSVIGNYQVLLNIPSNPASQTVNFLYN